MNELSNIINELSSHFNTSTIEKTANWIIYNNIWLKNENQGLNSIFYNYGRGDITLSIDFRTVNIGTEMRYPYPCVVLYDNGEDGDYRMLGYKNSCGKWVWNKLAAHKKY